MDIKRLKEDLYLESGYVNIKAILDTGYPFIFVVGGRGTGKTFGSLVHALRRDSDKRFIYMRRKQDQLDLINTPEFNPYKKVNEKFGTHIDVKKLNKKSSGFYEFTWDAEKGKAVPDGDLLGYTVALSTIATLRGFDASDADLIIYDEFIGEDHEHPIKSEYDAFRNAYETINRNRELEGEKPVQMLCLANSNKLANPIFMGMKIVDKLQKASLQGREIIAYPKRGVLIILLKESEISERKSRTALYRLDEGEDEFTQMSISNDFSQDDTAGVAPKPIQEYNCVAKLGALYIWQHKSRREYYICQHGSGSPAVYNKKDIRKFVRANWGFYDAFMKNLVFYDSYLTKSIYLEYTGN